jgi:hypothetical protein
VLVILEEVPLVLDELDVPVLDVEFCAAKAWALSINACAAEEIDVGVDKPEVVDEEAVFDVPDVVLVVAVEFVAMVAAVEVAGVVLGVVAVDAVVVVPTAVAFDVMLEGTADSQSTVTFTPLTTALLAFDTAVLACDDETDEVAGSNSV